jgi:hypothetical protein
MRAESGRGVDGHPDARNGWHRGNPEADQARCPCACADLGHMTADRYMRRCGPALGVPTKDNAAGPACVRDQDWRCRGVKALIGSKERADLGALAIPGRDRKTLRTAKFNSALLRWLARSLLSISNAVRPRVAGCLGNGSMLARGGSLMERLWIREVRRAARRASAPFARQVALDCGAAAVGTMVASLLPLLTTWC